MKTALVGFGLAGQVFHAPLIDHNPNLSLIGILSKKVDLIQTNYPHAKVFNDFDEVLSSEAELVVIATPNEFHFSQAKAALHADKHVLVDKPFTPTLEQASELIELAQKKDLILSIFHNRRLDGDFLTLKNIIKDKTLGNLSYLESNFNRFRPQVNPRNWRENTDIAGGIFYDLGPHLIDQILCLFGKPDSVYADIFCQRLGAVNDDYFHLIFKYAGMRIHLNANCLSSVTRERFVVQGDLGGYSKFGMDPQETQLKSHIHPEATEYGKDLNDFIGHSPTITPLPTLRGDYPRFYQNIFEHLNHKSNLLVTPAEAYETMLLMEQCLQANESKKEIYT